jgi:hypothetical protein
MRRNGKVLAIETDKAHQVIDVNADWFVYIHGDEVLNEKYHYKVRKSMMLNKPPSQFFKTEFVYCQYSNE